MKIAVLAANGRSGRAFVKYALEKGHSIRSGVRGASRLPEHPNLVTIECDATNPKQLRTLFSGQEAVVSLIGHTKHSAPNVQTLATEATIQVMQELGLQRIVSLTGTGVRFPKDQIPLIDRFLNLAVGVIDPNRVKDGSDHVALLQKSNLEWTVLRVLKLENVPSSQFSLTEHGPTKLVVNREDVAAAILSILTEQRFIRRAPIMSNTPL
jgi:putative NADH-flavin reductase